MTKGRIALLIGQIALAAIFIAAGYLKLREPWLQFAVSISSFKIVPSEWLEPLARWLPWCELALGIAILSGVLLRWCSLIATVLLAIFLVVLMRAWLLGMNVDCGCFGPGEALGPKRLLEEAAMLLLAAAVAFGAFRMATGKRRFA